MSFQDEIAKVIDSALAEKHREREEAAAFDAGWYRLREILVLPLFGDAAKAFVASKAEGKAHAGFANGSVRLSLLHMGQEAELTFSPDQKKEVICKSSFPDNPEERFTLDNLTEDVVRDKVARFVYHVITGKKWEPSVYDRRGILSF